MSQDQNPKTNTATKRKQTLSLAERLKFFNKQYPNGCIRTEQIEMLERPYFRATITPDISKPARYFTGHAQAVSGARIFKSPAPISRAEKSAISAALSLIISGHTGNEADTIKPAVCENCGRVWKRRVYQDRGILHTCPTCKLKKQLFLGLKVF